MTTQQRGCWANGWFYSTRFVVSGLRLEVSCHIAKVNGDIIILMRSARCRRSRPPSRVPVAAVGHLYLNASWNARTRLSLRGELAAAAALFLSQIEILLLHTAPMHGQMHTDRPGPADGRDVMSLRVSSNT
jgi:hypothetical protein